MGICRLKWFTDEVAMGVNQNIEQDAALKEQE
jgi:hypothetical protein